MADTELQLRKAIIDKCRWMNATGLNQGTSGNISARYGGTMLKSSISKDQERELQRALRGEQPLLSVS